MARKELLDCENWQLLTSAVSKKFTPSSIALSTMAFDSWIYKSADIYLNDNYVTELRCKSFEPLNSSRDNGCGHFENNLS